jgi:hypothetical protein
MRPTRSSMIYQTSSGDQITLVYSKSRGLSIQAMCSGVMRVLGGIGGLRLVINCVWPKLYGFG